MFFLLLGRFIPDSLLMASRICNETGKWQGDKSDYTACFALTLPRLWERMQEDDEEVPEDLTSQEDSNFVWVLSHCLFCYFKWMNVYVFLVKYSPQCRSFRHQTRFSMHKKKHCKVPIKCEAVVEDKTKSTIKLNLQDEGTLQWARIVAHIYFYGGLFSSILLSVTFFIFSYFK